MKHLAKPRTHSVCGQRLDRITLYEVIPAEQYLFQDKEYQEDLLPNELPDLVHELRCSHCNETLKGQDLEYVTKRLKNGKGQVSQTRTEEAEEG